MFYISDRDLDDVIPEENIQSQEMREFMDKVTPGHVLSYATGANKTPAAGFREHPRIVFIHDNSRNIPGANTCSYELLLYVNHRTITDEFATFMLEALMNGVVFSTL